MLNLIPRRKKWRSQSLPGIQGRSKPNPERRQSLLRLKERNPPRENAISTGGLPSNVVAAGVGEVVAVPVSRVLRVTLRSNLPRNRYQLLQLRRVLRRER
jgi:hypothetical protein